jgi:hypothetical protein
MRDVSADGDMSLQRPLGDRRNTTQGMALTRPSYGDYYSEYRGHTTLGGAVPAVMYRGERWDKPAKSAKTLPTNLERRVFPDTKITAYRLAA